MADDFWEFHDTDPQIRAIREQFAKKFGVPIESVSVPPATMASLVTKSSLQAKFEELLPEFQKEIVSENQSRHRKGKVNDEVQKRREKVGRWFRRFEQDGTPQREIAGRIEEATGLKSSDIDNDIRILKLRAKK